MRTPQLFGDETSSHDVLAMPCVTPNLYLESLLLPLKNPSITQWHDVIGLTRETFERPLGGRVFGKVVEAGFVSSPCSVRPMVEKLGAVAPCLETRSPAGGSSITGIYVRPSRDGAFTYEPTGVLAAWRRGLGQNLLHLLRESLAAFPPCWNCGNPLDEMAWHNPTQQPSATSADRETAS